MYCFTGPESVVLVVESEVSWARVERESERRRRQVREIMIFIFNKL
jgi:hypothetical protein